MIKATVIFLLFAILGSLGSAMVYLVRGRRGSKQVVQALTLRIGLSIFLFLLILIAMTAGWIKPHAPFLSD